MAREFWIVDFHTGKRQVSETKVTHETEFLGQGDFSRGIKPMAVRHVIEFSAYIELKQQLALLNEDHLCPLCKSETKMLPYEHHPDMRGPKPYDISCTNTECSHTWVPSHVENHINEFERVRATSRLTQLESTIDQLLKDKLINQHVYKKLKGE